MLVATVPAIEGRPVQWYLGVVSGGALACAAQFLGLFAHDGDGEDRAHGSRPLDLRDARDTAIFEMLREAAERGANAVIGVDLGYATVQVGGGMTMMVTVSGTAVRV